MKKLPDIERLNEIFIHDPETGFIYKKVGCSNPDGYMYVYVDGKQYAFHRLIWKLETGKDPEGVIDHINGIRNDNRIANLRDVTQAENMKNTRSRKQERRAEQLKHIQKMKEKWKLT